MIEFGSAVVAESIVGAGRDEVEVELMEEVVGILELKVVGVGEAREVEVESGEDLVELDVA